LTSQQLADLIDILDPLCAEVIYSRRHLLDLPHVVAQGESLEQIAKIYDIPPEIMARINAIDDPNHILVGSKLKVVPGPFRAEVDLKRSELTLFVGELYAGRFAISMGEDPAPREGIYQIVEKQKDRNYYGKGGTQILGSDPRNPYGGWWMDLGQDLCIHGSADQPGGSEKLGCISLSPIDARDVFGMLSRGSKVQIRR
jgi:LysM repeat protein